MAASNNFITICTKGFETEFHPRLITDPQSKVGFVNIKISSTYGVENNYFTLGFHRNIATTQTLAKHIFKQFEIFYSDLLVTSHQTISGSVSVEEAQTLGQAIADRFTVPVVLIQVPKNDGSMDFTPSELQIHDIRQFSSIMDFVYQEGFRAPGNTSLFPSPYLSFRDYNHLPPLCSEINWNLSKIESLHTKATSSHIQILRTLSKPFIDRIIKECEKIETNLDLDDFFPPLKEPFIQKDFTLAWLIECCQGICSCPLTPDEEVSHSFDAAVGQLEALYNGSSEFERACFEKNLGIPVLSEQRKALLHFIIESVEQRFGHSALISFETEQQALSRGISSSQLLQLTTRLFSEGFCLDPFDVVWGEEVEDVIRIIAPFHRVIEALDGELQEEDPYHPWITPEGKNLEGDEAQQHFKTILERVLCKGSPVKKRLRKLNSGDIQS